MKSFASCCLSIIAVSLLLAACQSAPQVAELPTDERLNAFRLLDRHLASGRLGEAEGQLNILQQHASGDTRLEQYQRQLAEAYLQQGQQALQSGDLDRATKALSHARRLMPQAPALTTGLDGTIVLAREAGKPTAKLIDPAAASSVVPLPMLDKPDNERLHSLLDSVAEDVVAFRCAVRIEVRQAKDYPRVAALLSARIKRLDPSFSPHLSQAIKPTQAPQLVLSPQRTE